MKKLIVTLLITSSQVSAQNWPSTSTTQPNILQSGNVELFRINGSKDCVIFPRTLTLCSDPPKITVQPNVNADEAARKVIDAIDRLLGEKIECGVTVNK